MHLPKPSTRPVSGTSTPTTNASHRPCPTDFRYVRTIDIHFRFQCLEIWLYLYISISHKSQSVLSGVSERNYLLSPHPTVALAAHITIQHTNNYPLLNIHAVLRHLPFYRGFRNKRGISSASTFTQSPCCLL